MLKWLTERAYNNFDPLWICVSVLCLHDRRYFAATAAVVVGSFISGFLEGWQANRRPNE